MVASTDASHLKRTLDEVWAVVEDVLSAPDWQGGLKDVEELERDGEGHVTLVESSNDAKVRTIKSTVRFDYDGPTRLSWTQEKGELKSVDGAWDLEEVGDGRTKATYSLEVELGRSARSQKRRQDGLQHERGAPRRADREGVAPRANGPRAEDDRRGPDRREP